MSKPVKIKTLEEMARKIIGDGKNPNLFFVTDQGVVVTVTRDFKIAYNHWHNLSQRRPLVESALEDRQTGVIASVEPIEDGSTKFEVIDSTPSIVVVSEVCRTVERLREQSK